MLTIDDLAQAYPDWQFRCDRRAKSIVNAFGIPVDVPAHVVVATKAPTVLVMLADPDGFGAAWMQFFRWLEAAHQGAL